MNPPILVEIPKKENTTYNIYIDKNPISDLSKSLDELTCTKRRLIIISKKVYSLYKNKFSFNKKELFILKDGEEQKNIKNYLKIIKKAFDIGLSRKDVIIAIGGGVIGDIAGYVAATYMRGIELIQVPTTLLSFVDSSVGGKTGIDLPFAKNYIGAFYQPSNVFINLNFLLTLDKRQLMSGYGEIIKYAFIETNCKLDKSYLLIEFLSVAIDRILENNLNLIERVVRICLELKIGVVSQDEKESGLRKVLNFGHTLGHALETITKYKKYTHGEAVVYGMMFAFNYALKKNMIDKKYYDTAFEIFTKYGFKNIRISNSQLKKLVDIMKYDKKSYSGKIVMILPDRKASVCEREIIDIEKFTM